MDDWKNAWAGVDDDYLAGIANKGIVKRAYKDKADGAYQVLSFGEESEVSVGAETVHIRFPLGESSCSCPSRSVCRHIILGILALRELAEENGSGKVERNAFSTIDFESAKADMGYKDEKKEDKIEKKEETKKKNVTEEAKAETLQKLREEIKAYPMASIRRILGGRQLQAIAGQAKAGQWPDIVCSSVITVDLQGMGQKVKLLSPLEYSSCTCHKKEVCIHKAAAILWCKLDAKELTAEKLEEEAENRQEYDIKQVREAAGQMKAFLEELFNTGLARVSPDITDYLERLSLVSHNAALARFEGYWRALYDFYGDYLKRKASFRVKDLMEQLARLYHRTELLLAAESGAEIGRLAGEFKGEYRPAGNLNLTGIAIEHFESKTGYEGETVYFLNEDTKEWYTYTSARPMYYEKKGRQSGMGNQPAPWGLPLSLAALAESRIRLTGAKCDGLKRLSSSRETKGELAGSQGKGTYLCSKDLGNWYYRDFGKLYIEQIGKEKVFWLGEKEKATELVFLRPRSCKKAFFSETEQKLFMSLYDEEKREVVIEVAYADREAWGIRYLERITEEKLPCFLGKIYLRDGKIRMYPVAVLEKEKLEEEKWEEEKLEEENREPEETEGKGAKKKDDAKQRDGISSSGKETKEEILSALLEDIGSLLEELCQSGFDAVHDSTLEALERMEKLTAQYGMAYLSGMLEKLTKELFMRRHQLERKEDGLAQIYANLNEYLYLCRKKTAYDIGYHLYCDETGGK